MFLFADRLEESGCIPSHSRGRDKISSEVSLLLFLLFVSNDDPHRILADVFDVSISSVFRIIRRVVDWFLSFVPAYITWPFEEEARESAQAFEGFAGIKQCIGAIKATHIQIMKPIGNAMEFCHVGVQMHSIILQAVVDANGKFTNVYCGQPGSVSNAEVLYRSDLFQSAETNKEACFPNNTFLIGDSSYEEVYQEWLVSPFQENRVLSDNHVLFNAILTSTSAVVDTTFGIWKGRFQKLKKKVQLFDLQFVSDLVVSCCVLHNICLENGDDGAEFYDDNWNEKDPPVQNEDFNPVMEEHRTALFQEMFGVSLPLKFL